MKKLSLLTVLALLFMVACSPVEDPTAEAELGAKAYIGQVNDEGNADFTVDKDILKSAIEETYLLESTGELQIVAYDFGYFMQGSGLIDEHTKTTFAISLDLDPNGDLSFAGPSYSQSCTSNPGCTGCELTATSPNSGSCKCVASNTWVDPSRGTCTHSVSVTFADKKMEIPGGHLKVLVENINRALR